MATPQVSGSIQAPLPALSQDGAMQTLDEPVSATIARDLRRVGIKLKYVLIPRQDQEDTLRELKNWDLCVRLLLVAAVFFRLLLRALFSLLYPFRSWGPLILCLLLSVMLSIRAPPGQTSLMFASVFVIIWCGAAVVTVNAQLLGGTLSFFQSVCVLGYCVFPLNMAAALCYLWNNSVFRMLVVSAGCVWSSRSSVVFMSQLVAPSRKALAVYPVFLFYVVLAWVILVGSYSNY